jgi:hypoxanthine phosphoribosyltransferase
MSITPEQAQLAYQNAELIHDEATVEAALDRMAEEITARIKDTNPLVLGVMLGGLIPTGKLLTRLDFPLQLDYLHATRYRGETRGGELHWIAHTRVPMRDRVVLVIDDILDEGATLAAILQHCRDEGAREVIGAVLVNKLHDRKAPDAHADIIGLEVDDRYVFGYGMDYKGFLRNAPGIFAAREE